MEMFDHKTVPTKLWRTTKAIDGKSTPKDENEAIPFDGSQVSSPKADRQLFQLPIHHFKAGQTNFFPGDPISNTINFGDYF